MCVHDEALYKSTFTFTFTFTSRFIIRALKTRIRALVRTFQCVQRDCFTACDIDVLRVMLYISLFRIKQPNILLLLLLTEITVLQLVITVMHDADCDRKCPDGHFISDTCGSDVRQGDVCCCRGNFVYFRRLLLCFVRKCIYVGLSTNKLDTICSTCSDADRLPKVINYVEFVKRLMLASEN